MGRLGIVLALGTAQTLAWGSTYYLPAILAAPMAREFAVSSDWVFGAFSAALLEKAGASRTMAITAAALVGPAQVAARILEFTLLQRIHPLLSARIASMTHPVGALAFLGFGVPAAYFFALLHGAGNGVMTIAKGTLPLVIFGPGGYGRRQGFLAMPSRVTQAVAPFAFAVLVERYGEYALLASSVLCLTGFAAMLSLRASPVRYSG